jgi:hypothetical protein
MMKMFSTWMTQVGEFRLAPGAEINYRAGTVMSLKSLPLVWG